jgi:hypothetical protein
MKNEEKGLYCVQSATVELRRVREHRLITYSVVRTRSYHYVELQYVHTVHTYILYVPIGSRHRRAPCTNLDYVTLSDVSMIPLVMTRIILITWAFLFLSWLRVIKVRVT